MPNWHSLPNPFDTPGIPDIYVGSEEAKQTLDDAITTTSNNPTGKTIVISAPSGYGKTTLLNHLARTAKRNGLIYATAQDSSDRSGAVSKNLIDGLKRSLARDQPAHARLLERIDSVTLGTTGPSVKFGRQPSGLITRQNAPEALEAAVITAAESKTPMVLLIIDEGHATHDDDLDALNRLTLTAKAEQLPVLTVIAGLPALNLRMNLTGAGSFMKYADRIDLKPLETHAASHYLSETLARVGVILQPKHAHQIAGWAGGHPHLLNQVGGLLHATAKASRKPNIDQHVISEALPQLQTRMTQFYAAVWNTLDADQKNVLASAHGHPDTTATSTTGDAIDHTLQPRRQHRAIQGLQAKGVLTEHPNGTYDIHYPGIIGYARQQLPRRPPPQTPPPAIGR